MGFPTEAGDLSTGFYPKAVINKRRLILKKEKG
jgi:hypothetical protein